MPDEKSACMGKMCQVIIKALLFSKNYIFFSLKIKTDRIVYCDEILNRYKDLSEEIKNEILEVRNSYSNGIKNKRRMKSTVFLLKHYSNIYTTKSKKRNSISFFFNFFKKNKLGEKA